jgi:hypothetical protein
VTESEDWQRALVERGKMLAQLKAWAERLHKSQEPAAIVFPADLQQAFAEMAELLVECVRLDARGPRGKTKAGRPGFWKSVEGLRLVEAVEEIKAKKHCTIAHALKQACKTEPFKDLKPTCRHDERGLEARYQDAVKHWSFVWGPYFKERAAMNVRLLAAGERLAAAFNRWQMAAGRPTLPKDFT